MSPTEGVPIPTKISPPSYSAVAGSAHHHHHHHHNVTSPVTSPPSSSSYPAVLVGRANNEIKPKVPPPVPPRGTPKVKRGGTAAVTTITTTASSVGKGDGSLHDVFRFPLVLHGAMNRIRGFMRGRIFTERSEVFLDFDEKNVHLKKFKRFSEGGGRRRNSAISENLKLNHERVYFSPNAHEVYMDDNFCRVNMDSCSFHY